MGWLVAAGILTILALMPVGVLARYNDQGFAAAVVLGPFRLSVYPRNKRGKKKKNA